MKSLVVGNGQVGSSLYAVIKEYHESYVKDVEDLPLDGVEILHVCIPYSDKFVEIVNGYIELYKPLVTVNHSSVPIGTTENLKGAVVYSPIRGKHPNLAKDIRTFEKFVAGESHFASIVAEYFRKCGMLVVLYDKKEYMRTLEFCKLMTNIRYGYEIAFMQEADRISKTFGLDIDIFNVFEKSYNRGYDTLDQSYMKRPILYGGFIGGHCVTQNCDILSEQYKSEMIDWILFSNNKKRVDTKGE